MAKLIDQKEEAGATSPRVISQLVTGRRLSRREREEFEYTVIGEEDHSYDPSLYHLTLASYQHVDSTSSRLSPFHLFLSFFGSLFPLKNDGQGDATVGLFALKEHVTGAKHVLSQIDNTNEELRTLLVDKFELEDIL